MTVPGNIDALLLGGQRGYQIERSLRFNSADSAYLNRTPASAGNRKTWTWSGWVKLGSLSSARPLFAAYIGSGSTDNEFFSFFIEDGLLRASGYSTVYLTSTAVHQDPSGWYHVVSVVDTTSATANNRIRFYVNGTELTAFSTRNNPSLNADLGINQAAQHQIGQNGGFGSYFDGYLTEVHFIDGQALDPSSFGETDTITGVWKPKKYAGTYGTNGFYLKFADNSGTTSTTLGKDSSGNSNNWTPNNFSVTAGAGNDSLIDTPTPYADGGNGRGNYCTLNPLDDAGNILSNGNLDIQGTGNTYDAVRSTIAMSSGKWYSEFVINTESVASRIVAGLLAVTDSNDGYLGDTAKGYSIFESGSDVRKYNNLISSVLTSSASLDPGDVQMIAFNADTGKLWFGKNGTWFASGNPAAGTNEVFSGLTSGPYAFATSAYNTSDTGTFNFGQRAFAYTPPSGFLALNTQNLPEPSIKKPNQWMDINLATGNNSTQTITNAGGFQPSLVWMKIRSATENHILYDAVRGTDNFLVPNLTNAEASGGGQGLTSFNSNGFTLGSINPNYAGSPTFVAWQWKESATPGFDIVTYTGNGTNRTIAHSLGVAPSMMIVKNRTSAGNGWPVYHQSANVSPATGGLRLNLTDAFVTYSPYWNNTAPTSSVFTVGTDSQVNGNTHEMVAYLWSEVAGFSKFGSYTGNGSTDGPFVFCGFRPKFVMFKCSSSSESGNADWHIQDSSRNASNISTGSNRLFANLSAAESSNAEYKTDFLSNGFKLRTDGVNYGQNNNGNTYIFAAFAESPQKYSLAR